MTLVKDSREKIGMIRKLTKIILRYEFMLKNLGANLFTFDLNKTLVKESGDTIGIVFGKETKIVVRLELD